MREGPYRILHKIAIYKSALSIGDYTRSYTALISQPFPPRLSRRRRPPSTARPRPRTSCGAAASGGRARSRPLSRLGRNRLFYSAEGRDQIGRPETPGTWPRPRVPVMLHQHSAVVDGHPHARLRSSRVNAELHAVRETPGHAVVGGGIAVILAGCVREGARQFELATRLVGRRIAVEIAVVVGVARLELRLAAIRRDAVGLVAHLVAEVLAAPDVPDPARRVAAPHRAVAEVPRPVAGVLDVDLRDDPPPARTRVLRGEGRVVRPAPIVPPAVQALGVVATHTVAAGARGTSVAHGQHNQCERHPAEDQVACLHLTSPHTASHGRPLHTRCQRLPAETARRRCARLLGSCQYKCWQISELLASPGLGKLAKKIRLNLRNAGMAPPSPPRDTLPAVAGRRQRRDGTA